VEPFGDMRQELVFIGQGVIGIKGFAIASRYLFMRIPQQYI
jgi:hypothetical protein